MKISINDLWVLLIVNATCFCAPAFSQTYLETLAKEDHEIVSSVAPYVEDIRKAVLDISQYPQTLVKLQRIQSKSSQSFKNLIGGFSREDQINFYDVSRYPEQLALLVREGKNNPQTAKLVVVDLPIGSQTRILKLYESHFRMLQLMDQIFQSSQAAFKKVIATYSQRTQDNFVRIIAKPDIMNLLTDNIDLTVSLGEAYRANPRKVELELDSIHDQVTARDEKDLADYKAAVETNTQMQEEMKNAAKEFSTSYALGNNLNITDDINQSNQVISSPETLNNYYNYNSYPYWFGYPYWYKAAMWYPMPYYYNTGFYYGFGGRIIVVGLPSHFYASWFFNTGYQKYPLLNNHYNTYYNVHRRNVGLYRGFDNEANNRLSVSNDRSRSGLKVNPIQNTSLSQNIEGASYGVHTAIFNRHAFQQFHAASYHRVGWARIRTVSRGAWIDGRSGQ